MPLIPLNLTGGSYLTRSRPLSSQSTINFYPELQDDPFVLSKFVLQPWPGTTLFSPGGSGADRGMLAHKGVLYKVSGTQFYTVDSDGTHVAKGTIAGVGQCILKGFRDTVLITNSIGNLYQYTTTITESTDPTLQSPTSVAVLKRRAIYDGNDGNFMASKVNDAVTINALDVAEAEADEDNIIRVYDFKKRLWLYGEKTIEPWWNSDVGRPPLDPIEAGITNIGLGSRMSVASNDNFMYFLGDDRVVYRVLGVGQSQPVSNIALSSTFADYGTVNDAIGFCFTLAGQNFYHLSFPVEDKTWIYSEPVGQWFQTARSPTNFDSPGRDLANSYAFIYGKHLIADYRNSNIYEWRFDTYTEYPSLSLTRARTTGPIHGELVGAPGAEIELSRFEILLDRGVGIISGQGSDPQIMLQISIDGGRTYGTELRGKIGKSGDFMRKVEWHSLGRFAEGIFRIKTSDPVSYCIHSANAEIEIVN